jgi:hypothetical protein
MRVIQIIIFILLTVTPFVGALVSKVAADIRQINEGIVIDHKKEAWQYFWLLLFSITGLIVFCGLSWFGRIILPLVLIWFCWVTFFDGTLNLKRGLSFFHVSRANYQGKAITEKFWSALPQWAVVGVKIAGVSVTIILYILNFKFI